MLACEVVPSQEETPRKLRTGLQNGGPTILPGWHWLFLGFENEHLNFALATPDGTFALRVRFQHYALQPGYPSGSVRNDGTEYAAPLVKRPGYRQ
ncbi:hypothetical protein ACP0HM_11460 [Escherichia coli]